MFISCSSGGWESTRSRPAGSETGGGPFLVSRVLAWKKKKETVSLVSLLVRALIPLRRAAPSQPNHLPEAQPPTTVPSGVRASTYGIHTFRLWQTQLKSSPPGFGLNVEKSPRTVQCPEDPWWGAN